MELTVPQIVIFNSVFCPEERAKLNLYNSLSTWHPISSIAALSEYLATILLQYNSQISNLHGDKPTCYVIVFGSSLWFHAVLGHWGNVYPICMRICLEKCLMALKYYATPASSYTRTAISTWTLSNTFIQRNIKPSGLCAVQTMVTTPRPLLIRSHQFHITLIQQVLSVNQLAGINKFTKDGFVIRYRLKSCSKFRFHIRPKLMGLILGAWHTRCIARPRYSSIAYGTTRVLLPAYRGLPGDSSYKLTIILLTWRIWWALNNASKWQMGFNSKFKGLD
jgi:hypothetical protein